MNHAEATTPDMLQRNPQAEKQTLQKVFSKASHLQRFFVHVLVAQVRASFNELGRPNADVAMGVDTRQELDLRVGPQTWWISCGVLRKGDAKHPRVLPKV